MSSLMLMSVCLVKHIPSGIAINVCNNEYLICGIYKKLKISTVLGGTKEPARSRSPYGVVEEMATGLQGRS